MIHNTQITQISQKQDGRNIHAIIKTICPTSYHHSGFVATHALGHMMCGYTLLVPMNQRVLRKLSKEQYISGHHWSTTHKVLKSHRRKIGLIYIQSSKQCALPVITTMANDFYLWQLMHLGTWCTVTHCWYQWTMNYEWIIHTIIYH